MQYNNIDTLVQYFQIKLISGGFEGEFHIDIPTRIINATDNSIYELMPQAVIQPKHENDVILIFEVANLSEFMQLSFTPRGGGTGTNGQSLSHKIIIDISRFMTNIINLDIEAQIVTLEPGVVLSNLNHYLEPYGLFFAPNISTADRATIGGMIATDAAGKGSLIYGKTSDHVLGIKMALASGELVTFSSPVAKDCTNLEDKCIHGDLLSEKVVELLKPKIIQDEISKRFLPLKRSLSGYNIKDCYIDGKCDLTKIISGAEGTLGVVTRATLKLLPIPKHKALVIIHYASFLDALKASQSLIRYKPLAIEAIDEKVQKSAQTLPNWHMLERLLNSVGKNYISNFMEIIATDEEDLNSQLTRLKVDFKEANSNYVIITDHYQINQLWSIRSLAVGLVGKIAGVSKPIAFVEDAIVPPENLADFVAELQEYLNVEGLNYAVYGHVDVGCIHVRPALNMQSKIDRDKIRPITEVMLRLLDKYHGVLWGEHGKGFRGEFVPDVFGGVLYSILCKIKALFDPHNKLNSGKLTTPDSQIMKLVRIDEVPMRGELDQVISLDNQAKYYEAMLCNGNAACFSQELSNVMCPSYKITKDRVHSPKGRAMLVKQWLRALANGDNHHELAKQTLIAMNGCLGCKGCVGKCPTQVSIPDLRSTFLNNYHKQYQSPTIQEKLLGYIEHILVVATKYPRIWNIVMHLPFSPHFGMSSIPKTKLTAPLKSELKKFGVNYYTGAHDIHKLINNPVVIFVDPFTGFLDHEVLLATINTIKVLGFTPYVIYPRVSGKSLIVGGFINQFVQNCAKLSKLFTPLCDANIPIIALENTVTLMFRDEVKKLSKPFIGKVLTITEFINNNLDKLNELDLKLQGKYKLLPHCTEQALAPNESILWKNIFAKFGVILDVQNAGCCGMAGTYGYQKEHEQNSIGLFNLNWGGILDKANSNSITVVASGFSCRCQTQKIISQVILHPIQIIQSVISQDM